MNPDLAAALARLDAAIGQLDASVARHFDADLRRSDIEMELQVMGDDRARLATDLESASARVAQLESAADHVGARLGAAIGSIQDILAAERPSSTPARG
ncbi:DUF4164 family protein [Enterovirga rhinocerotis]|nr:DUF4164 family protein [Enterovirga rhinocerotis]